MAKRNEPNLPFADSSNVEVENSVVSIQHSLGLNCWYLVGKLRGRVAENDAALEHKVLPAPTLAARHMSKAYGQPVS
eukprot:1150130-Pelagomonas_calceolata.AAC.9